MTADKLSTILAALVTMLGNIKTGGVRDFKTYTSSQLATSQISAYPAAIVTPGPANPNLNITSTFEMKCQVMIRLIGVTTTAELLDLSDKLTDAIMSDTQLGNTCLSCLPRGFDPPFVWQDKLLILDRLVEITYQRDF